jgi:hypothetical protein
MSGVAWERLSATSWESLWGGAWAVLWDYQSATESVGRSELKALVSGKSGSSSVGSSAHALDALASKSDHA